MQIGTKNLLQGGRRCKELDSWVLLTQALIIVTINRHKSNYLEIFMHKKAPAGDCQGLGGSVRINPVLKSVPCQLIATKDTLPK